MPKLGEKRDIGEAMVEFDRETPLAQVRTTPKTQAYIRSRCACSCCDDLATHTPCTVLPPTQESGNAKFRREGKQARSGDGSSSSSNKRAKSDGKCFSFFQRGHCSWGSKCRFSHEKGDATAPASSSVEATSESVEPTTAAVDAVAVASAALASETAPETTSEAKAPGAEP